MMKNTPLVIFLLLHATLYAQQKPTAKREARLRTANEIERSIKTELLNKWYPKNTDSLYGGFITTYTYNFKPSGEQDKFIVTQARHTWSTAKASELYPKNASYLKCSEHGFKFLRDVMWDKTYGGFYNLVDREGKVKNSSRGAKDAYGNAFGIYALAAYYHASKDSEALNFAKRAFLWLDKHAHDPIQKGYFQHLNRDGSIIKRNSTVASTSDLGYKDQNSSIHLLEAFTELYSVWPDPLLRHRLEEMLYLIRDKITTERGYLTLFFKPDWTAVSFKDSSKEVILQHSSLDHVSFGHDVETAYLMLEASHILGLKDDKRTLSIAKKMVDHALRNGWDNSTGGFYDEGYYFKGTDSITIIRNTKNWWAQAEGMNTLLMMADLFPNDPMNYYSKFNQLWKYINTYLIDHQYGDWYEGGLDKQPEKKTALKGHIWKATYHQFRAMMNCVKRLRK